MSVRYKLPADWLETTLGEAVDYGKAAKVEPDEIADDSWVLELEDIEKDSSKILRRVTFAERKSKSTKNCFHRGDVLYGKLRPYLNKVVIADSPGYCTTEIVPIKPSDAVDGRYLFYWLKHPTFLAYVTGVSHGLNMPRLGTEAGRRAPFLLAPLAEQKRIADKLDRLIAAVDTCKARLDAIPVILKRFRQSVLAAAMSGELTADWRSQSPMSATAEEEVRARESGRRGRLKVRGARLELDGDQLYELPNSWSWIENHRLAKDEPNSICAGPFGTIFKARDFRPVGIPIIFLRHVTENGYSSAKPGFMDEAVWKKFHQDYTVYGGELLVTKLGDPPGTACIFPENIGPAMVTPDVLKMSVDEHVANSKYLMYFFNSPSSKEILRSLAFGMTRLRIDIAMFKQFPIPTPCLEEQNEIVSRVGHLFAAADQIESAITIARERASSLTSAVLAKAFVGKLVPSDPNDEPQTS